MRTLLALILLCLSSLSFAATPGRPEVGPYMKAYCGDEGVHLWLVRVGPRANQEVLLQITGIDHPLDGRVLRAKLEASNSGLRYLVDLDGKHTEILRKSAGRLELLVPGMAPLALTYNQQLAEQLMPEHLLTAYLEKHASQP
ncbi:hypothetical protein [Massilia sp. TS11]|uniref:hypothetical protein n=1 Tax=Massilia sp. TS11 TaxID=2908003 RepID=UPI001EDC067F|nr:hypothetical protein [Massilia sp. TS11]MCG2585964.1 hypothetical protein [Massilia sp. TS11]